MRIVALSILVGSLFILTSAADAEDYYIYRDSKGALVLSNQKPPPGSTIVKQRTFPDQPTDQPTTTPPQVQVRPQTEPSVTERRSNAPADNLAPSLDWVWSSSI